jgi:hypothetical protein
MDVFGWKGEFIQTRNFSHPGAGMQGLQAGNISRR